MALLAKGLTLLSFPLRYQIVRGWRGGVRAYRTVSLTRGWIHQNACGILGLIGSFEKAFGPSWIQANIISGEWRKALSLSLSLSGSPDKAFVPSTHAFSLTLGYTCCGSSSSWGLRQTAWAPKDEALIWSINLDPAFCFGLAEDKVGLYFSMAGRRKRALRSSLSSWISQLPHHSLPCVGS